MLRSINNRFIITSLRNYVITITAALAAVSLSAQPRVATSFWEIVTPAYSDQPGYAVLHEGTKERSCVPITAYFGGYGEDDYHKLHHHGVAVESELMAYRIYFDKKQTIDVYCKRTPRMELATSYWYPNDSLLAAYYGDDILRVGGTIGVGSVNYWYDGKLRHFEEVGERQQWIKEQNDSMAVISVSDVDWTVPDKNLHTPGKKQMANFCADYTMLAGHRDMRCDVTVSKPVKGLCTGVQTIPNKGVNLKSQISNLKLPNGTLLVSFGEDWPVNDTVKYAKETVGLGVFIPTEFAGELVHNASNNLCLLDPQSWTDPETEITEYKAHFYLTCVGVTKEDHPVATTAEEWLDYLKNWAKDLQ